MVQPRSVIPAVLLWILPGIAAAQLPPQGGGYIGASIGQMDASEDCPSGFSCDFKDTAWKIYGGYRFNRHLAIEGTYGDWGEISLNTTFLGVPISATGEIWSAGVAAVGILPVDAAERFSLFGKLGIAYSKAKVSASAPGVPGQSDSESETELHYGFGVLFAITPSLSLRGEWEHLDDSEVDIISFGLQVRF